MKYPAYPAYKSSGVEWLGEVPKHWEVVAVRRLIHSIEQGWSPVAEDRQAAEQEWGVIKLSAINKGVFRPEEHKALPEDLAPDSRYELQVGDLLLTRANTPELVGDVCVVTETRPHLMLCDLAYRICPNPTQVDKAFLAFWFLSRVGRYQITRDARGSSQSMVKVSQTHIQSWIVALPSLSEQRAITNFLDRETAKLDTLIGKQQELIEKLKAKRTVLISRTVTRGLPPDAAAQTGLNPNPQLKASGIEWIGEVPEHWEVKQLKWAVTFQRGHDLPSEERKEGRVPIISSSGISGYHNVSKASGPGIVTGRYGTIGEFYLTNEDYWPLNTTLYSIDLRGNDAVFLRYMLKSLAPLFLSNSIKSAVPGVDRNDIHPIQIALPQFSEQRAIATFLDRETEKIDRLIEKVEKAITKLQLYRTSLITAAVTGKIDVREGTT